MLSYTLKRSVRYEEEIRKSRFIALAARVESARSALAWVDRHSVPEATHNCWAYQIGDEYRFFDDGEPGGTAGRPILQAIQGQNCDEVVVLVIRWFGGTKLGTGGLIRAYGGVAAECLRRADKVPLIAREIMQCHCPFAEMSRVQSGFPSLGIHIQSEAFDEHGVQWQLSVPEAKKEAFMEQFLNQTRGQGLVQKLV